MSVTAHDHALSGSTRLGIHSFVWSATTTDTILDTLPIISELGYHGAEIPLLAPDQLDIPRIRQELDRFNLDCTTSSALPPGLSLIDPAAHSETIGWVTAVVEEAAALGADILCGPLLVPIGEMRGRGRTDGEWEACVAGLQDLAAHIEDTGVVLAIEPLNRFETFFLNTVEDGVRLMREVDHPAFGLLLDTFHMNVEEHSIPAAIAAASGHIAHFHCSENDRGPVGSGHIPWDEVLRALDATGYRGQMVVESFGSALPEIATAASIWRPVAASPETLARESFEFLSEHLVPTISASRTPIDHD